MYRFNPEAFQVTSALVNKFVRQIYQQSSPMVLSFPNGTSNFTVKIMASDKMFVSRWVSVKHRISESKKSSEIKSI